MKAQFKYAFRAGISPRLIVFAILVVVNLAFILPGMLGIFPLAAQIVGVALSGCAIAVMLVFNVIGDIKIIGHTFSPGAAFFALAPVHRGKTLAANVLSMMIMDLVTMAVLIFGTVILSINLGSHYVGDSLWSITTHYYGAGWNVPHLAEVGRDIILYLAIGIAAYLSIVMTVLFSIAMRKSVLYNVPAGGFLALLITVAIVYITNLLNFLLVPFGHISRFFFTFTIQLGFLGSWMYALLLLIVAAVLFILTSRILERKLNI